LLLAARVARRTTDWAEADELLDHYWQLRGDDDDLVLERLLLRAAHGELEAARPGLQRHIDQDDAAAPLAREALVSGMLYSFRLGDAAAALERWLERSPESTTALLLQGKLDEMRDNNKGAVPGYRRLLELDAGHDEARLRLAGVLVEQFKGNEALEHLQVLSQHLPDHPGVEVLLAQALDQVGQSGEARAVLEKCLEHHPDHPGALAERGWIAQRDGQRDKAEELLGRAVRLDPGNFSTRYRFSQVLRANGKKDPAHASLDEAKRIERDLRRIREIIQEKVQQSPRSASLHFEAAMIALRLGQSADALRWLLSALQVDPEHPPTHRALALYYEDVGSPILAARHRAIAQRLAGSEP
jgi:tetratricopeptide (TPR) repeat protein